MEEYYRNYSGLEILYARRDVRVILVRFNDYDIHPGHPSTGVIKIQSSHKGQREFNYYRRLRHPHIIRCYCHFVDRNKSFLVLEAGKTSLYREINCRKPFDSRYEEFQLSQIFLKLAKAVEFMHSENIAHRDIKPLNIVEDAEGEVKIIDLGESKYIGRGVEAHTVTGTVPYMSPQLKSSYDCKTSNRDPFSDDIWALGVSIVELGLLKNISSISKEQFHAEVRTKMLDAGYSEEFARVLLKTLDLNPKRRITASELVEELQNLCFPLDETISIFIPVDKDQF